ncbi:hypothetical protein BDW42DRAFT_169717 [Aspergillus taichungensis]|uniref:Fungal N-terminal domain-containing protein n=1 Tax=Aspergillus taichungensis TaxID=482145 RepID=A0A2J5HUF0_9EURO|nr:hypothetical protein BDW42DRAFT_169717 [Aspergillus taichungensis]
MASNFEMVDIRILTKTAWSLYHNCNLVSRDAPDGFRQLVNELASLQGVLRSLQDHVNSNQSFFDELAEDRKRILHRSLESCSKTLQRLKELITRYRNMGVGDGRNFWHKVRWVTQRGQIDQLKSSMMICACNLSLCTTSITNSSWARIEQSMSDALENEPFHMDPEASRTDGSPLMQVKSGRISEDDSIGPGHGRPTPRPRAATVTVAPRSRESTSSDSVMSGHSDGSALTAATYLPSSETSTQRSLSQTLKHGPLRAPGSAVPSARKIDREVLDYYAEFDDKLRTVDTDEPAETETEHTAVKEAIENAMQHLHQIRLRDQLQRPLKYEPRDESHRPNPELTKKFGELVQEELKIRRLSTSDWLRLAVWWLLKARTSFANYERPSLTNTRGSMSPSVDSSSTSQQAYVDLLKASYILYDVVLKDETSQALLTDENRKLISDLSEGIKDDFAPLNTVDIPDPSTIHTQNLDIWEPLQSGEAVENDGDSLLGLNNVRWMTVEQEDAGDEEEKVILRTFVNAGIGSKKLRMRKKGAPYMLLLTTREGESEPKIAICNQSGTFCLQRDFVPNDLLPLIKISNASISGYPGARISEPVSFTFGSINVSISFQYKRDLMQFISIPKAYFDAVWQREPVDSEQFSEAIIFRSSVELFEQLKAVTMRSTNPPMLHKSCEVRILERSYGEAWRFTRRLVISSSAAESMPNCMELFMPMSRVQVCREEDSRQVLLQWSDVCQEKTKSDGKYNELYSYIYDDKSPNIGLSLHFRTQGQAEEFEQVILSLSQKPICSWREPNSSGCVYDVVDPVLNQKQYKAIQIVQRRLSWKYTVLYFLYRDADYIYEHFNLRVHFPGIFYTDYISSHVDKLYRADRPVTFSHCEKKVGNLNVDFNDEHTMRAFMTSLASSHELLFSRRAVSLTTKGKSLFRSRNSGKGEAEVQIWRKGTSYQLAARWSDNITDRWLTVTIPPERAELSHGTNRIDFRTIASYSRGTFLNMADIAAVSPKDPNMARRSGPIAMVFPSIRDCEEFTAILDVYPGYRHYGR